MRIFISWSQEHAREMALLIRDWLPEVIQQIVPWMSAEDIAKGKRWSNEIAAELDATSQGIVCVTAANMREPWLNFEAGALAKSLQNGQVRPVLLDVQPQEVTGPLAEFQATVSSDADDMFKLVESLNAGCSPALTADRLRRAFDRTWPELSEKLTALRQLATEAIDGAQQPAAGVGRTAEDMFGEVLLRIRGVERDLAIVKRRMPNARGVVLARQTTLSDEQQEDVRLIIDGGLNKGGRVNEVRFDGTQVFIEFEGDLPEDFPSSLSEISTALRRRGVTQIGVKATDGAGARTEMSLRLGGLAADG